MSMLQDRLARLLQLVVEDVIQTGDPIGSQRVVDSYGLDMSAATIRNWFADLEAQGFLMQPHTSAGRIPTEEGYRYYLNELMDEPALRPKDRQTIERVLGQHAEDVETLRAFAKATASMIEEAVIVSSEDTDFFATGYSYLLSQPEFREMQHVQALGAALDRMSDIVEDLRAKRFEEPTALIGRDCPFGSSCSTIFLSLENGTLLGVVGPMRMDYRRSMALLHMARLLDRS